MVFYCYPENALKKEEKVRLADIMDQAFEEGFFTHRFGELSSMNYYFEIQSEWARGNKEMLMMSIIFDRQPQAEVEGTVLEWFTEFALRLKNNHELFKAFYNIEEIPIDNANYAEIKKHSDNLRFWVKELFFQIIEELREKTEEEKFATLLNQPNVFNLIKKLSKGPLALEDLAKWYNTIYNDKRLEEILHELEVEKFIFVNTIGQETFVLLVKEVNVQRVPPNNIIDLKEESPELADLTDICIDEVRDFFDHYTLTLMDSLDLFKLIANPKIYNVIIQLREGPLPQEKIFAMVSEKATKVLIEYLELLKEKNIIQELSYSGEKLFILKTDIVFTASFPEYLKKLLPREAKGYIARAFAVRRFQSIGEEPVEPDNLSSLFPKNDIENEESNSGELKKEQKELKTLEKNMDKDSDQINIVIQEPKKASK